MRKILAIITIFSLSLLYSQNNTKSYSDGNVYLTFKNYKGDTLKSEFYGKINTLLINDNDLSLQWVKEDLIYTKNFSLIHKRALDYGILEYKAIDKKSDKNVIIYDYTKSYQMIDIMLDTDGKFITILQIRNLE